MLNQNSPVLGLEGIKLDTISTLVTVHDAESNVMTILNPMLCLGETYTTTGEPMLEVLFRAIVQNSFEDQRRPDGSEGYRKIPYKEAWSSFQSWLRYRIAVYSWDFRSALPFIEASEEVGVMLLHLSLFPSAEEIAKYYQRFLELMQSDDIEASDWEREVLDPILLFREMSGSTENMAWIFTRGNLLGVAPVGAQKDDEIWVLRGARVPFVLRPREHGGYSLIGEAYVHGYMNGEIFSRNGCRQEDAVELEIH